MAHHSSLRLGASCGKQENAANPAKPPPTQPEVVEKTKPTEPKPSPSPIVAPTPDRSADILEAEIRRSLKKPKGELTQADLERVTRLSFSITKITDADLKEVAQLQKLTGLYLGGCRQITNAGVAELKQALPKCAINR